MLRYHLQTYFRDQILENISLIKDFMYQFKKWWYNVFSLLKHYALDHFKSVFKTFLKMDRKALAKFSKKICEQICPNCTKVICSCMTNSKLPKNFQFNIFIFEVRANLRTLKRNGPGWEFLGEILIFFCEQIHQDSKIFIRTYAQQ